MHIFSIIKHDSLYDFTSEEKLLLKLQSIEHISINTRPTVQFENS